MCPFAHVRVHTHTHTHVHVRVCGRVHVRVRVKEGNYVRVCSCVYKRAQAYMCSCFFFIEITLHIYRKDSNISSHLKITLRVEHIVRAVTTESYILYSSVPFLSYNF